MRAWVAAAPFLALTLFAPLSPAVAHPSGDRRATAEVAADSGPAAQPGTGGLPTPSPRGPGAAPRVDSGGLDRLPLDRLPEALGMALALAAGALAGGALGARRHARRLATSATGVLLLAFVVESTPHLVHHALDPEQGTGCRALQLSERHPVAVEPPETLAPPPVLSGIAPSMPRIASVVALPVPRGRAPPA